MAGGGEIDPSLAFIQAVTLRKGTLVPNADKHSKDYSQTNYIKKKKFMQDTVEKVETGVEKVWERGEI